MLRYVWIQIWIQRPDFFSSKPCTYTVSMQICTVLLHRPSFYMCVCTASPASVCVPLTYAAACCFSALARVAAQLPAVWLTGFSDGCLTLTGGHPLPHIPSLPWQLFLSLLLPENPRLSSLRMDFHFPLPFSYLLPHVVFFQLISWNMLKMHCTKSFEYLI